MPMASSASCLWRSSTGGSTASPARKASQSTSIHLMPLLFFFVHTKTALTCEGGCPYFRCRGTTPYLVSSVSRFSSGPSIAGLFAHQPGFPQ